MTLSKAICTKCGEEIEVDSKEEAGICPACGKAFITKNAISNYKKQEETTSTRKSRNEDEFDELVERYEAFVTLHNPDYRDFLKVVQADINYIKAIEERDELVAQYDEYTKKAKKWDERYVERAKDYNKKKFTLGAESWSEKLMHKYVDHAGKKRDTAVDVMREQDQKIRAAEKKIQDLDKEYHRVQDSVKDIFLNRVFDVAYEMCERFPSNPKAYLYVVDANKRDIDWMIDAIENIIRRYKDIDIFNCLKKDIDTLRKDDEIMKEYLEKAKKFIRYADDDTKETLNQLSAETKKNKTKINSLDKKIDAKIEKQKVIDSQSSKKSKKTKLG